MASVAFTVFLPEVAPQVPECPEPAMVNAIRNAAIEFCSDTMYWQETRPSVTLAPADFPYALPAPTGARVIQPLSVINSDTGAPIPPKSIEWLDASIYNWRNQGSVSPPYYYQPDPDHLLLAPPLADGETITLVLRVAYTPKRDATTIEEWVYQNYKEGIAYGALGRLQGMLGQPWSNANAAIDSRQKFSLAKQSARVEATKAFTRASGQVKFRRA